MTSDADAAMGMSHDDAVRLVQTLFVQHTSAIRGFVHALAVDFARVDDVVQETFLTVTRKASDFRPGTNFMAWVCTIARLKSLEVARSDARGPKPLSEETLDALVADRPEDLDDPIDERLWPALAACLNRLAPQARRAVELRYMQGIAPGEIAKRLGWGPPSVYVALSRARNQLRQCVEKRLADPAAS
jgi:RNA polymerase sigma-70 factor (ECF subfamily)